MKKNHKAIARRKKIEEAIKGLDKSKIHILYFSYYFNFHNLKQNPLLLTTKLLNFVTRKPSIDHVAHISRYVKDEETGRFLPKVFEANRSRGMEESDVVEKLRNFQGICYVDTIDAPPFSREIAKQFEIEHSGEDYGDGNAVRAGIDLNFIEKNLPSDVGIFCSEAAGKYLIKRGVNLDHVENGDPSEMTPTDLFLAGLGDKKMFFKY